MPKRLPSSGTLFENAIAATCAAYSGIGICHLEKVDPPTKFSAGHIIQLANPFLDFVGPWTELGGKMLMVECKSTVDDILPIGQTGITAAGKRTSTSGINLKQIEAGFRWQRAGAAVCYLWQHGGGVKLVTPNMVAAQLGIRKSLRWCDCHSVPQGKGLIIYDFLALLRPIHKPKTPTPP